MNKGEINLVRKAATIQLTYPAMQEVLELLDGTTALMTGVPESFLVDLDEIKYLEEDDDEDFSAFFNVLKNEEITRNMLENADISILEIIKY